MYTIWFRSLGDILHIDVHGEWQACRVWDVLATTFDMVSQRPAFASYETPVYNDAAAMLEDALDALDQ